MRVGIVGAGIIFRDHLSAHRQIGNAVSHLVDIDEARARTVAGINGIPNFTTDWRELLNDEIDVIDICTPPKFHAEIAIAALHAGKHVICEKPLAATLAECDQIIEAEKSSSGKLLPVHQYRYNSEQQQLRWLVDEGHLGDVCFARVVRYSPPPRALVQNGTWGNWALAGGGVLMTKTIHYLDLLCWLLGPVRCVQASMDTFINSIESEDHVAATLDFESGALASIAVSGSAYRDLTQFELVGSRGSAGRPWFLRMGSKSEEKRLAGEIKRKFPSASVSKISKLIQKASRKLPIISRMVRKPKSRGPSQHARLFKEFLSTIEDPHFNGSCPSVEDGRRAVELCTAIYAAAITGEKLALPLDATNPFYRGISKQDYVDRQRRPSDHRVSAGLMQQSTAAEISG